MHFTPIVLSYDYKFLKMGIQGKCVSFYFYGSFFMITFFKKNGYTKKMCVFLFLWFFLCINLTLKNVVNKILK